MLRFNRMAVRCVGYTDGFIGHALNEASEKAVFNTYILGDSEMERIYRSMLLVCPGVGGRSLCPYIRSIGA